MWQAANNGAGKMRWFLIKETPGEPTQYHERKDGQLRRFGSYEAANRAAELLNKAPRSILGEDLRAGTVIVYSGVRTTVLIDTHEPHEDRFGRTLSRVWARREDTGAEGWLAYGPGGVFALA